MLGVASAASLGEESADGAGGESTATRRGDTRVLLSAFTLKKPEQLVMEPSEFFTLAESVSVSGRKSDADVSAEPKTERYGLLRYVFDDDFVSKGDLHWVIIMGGAY